MSFAGVVAGNIKVNSGSSLTQRDRINLKTLQRIDPCVQRILLTASESALYEYQESSWVKLDMEGVFFVYERKASPKHGFLVLNKNSSKENLIEPITKELDFQLQDPFVLYKTKSKKIYGLWFSEPSFCSKVHSLIARLIKETKQLDEPTKSSPNQITGASIPDVVSQEHPRKQQNTLEALMNRAAANAKTPTSQKEKKTPQSVPPKTSNNVDDESQKLLHLLQSAEKLPRQSHSEATLVMKRANAKSEANNTQSADNVAAFFAKASESTTPTMANIVSTGPRQILPRGGMLPQGHNSRLPHPTALLPPPGSVPAPPEASVLPKGDSQDSNNALQRLLAHPSAQSLEGLEMKQLMESLKSSATNVEDIENQLMNKENVTVAPEAKLSKSLIESSVQSKPVLVSPGALERSVTNNGNGVLVPPPGLAVAPSGTPHQLPTAPRVPQMETMVADERQNPQKYVLAREQFEGMFRYLLATDPGFVDLLHNTYIQYMTSGGAPSIPLGSQPPH